MSDQPGVWGIDIGQCALKAVRLALIDGKMTATAFDYVEHPKILSQPDADPDQLTRDALDKFLSRNTLKGDTICISVPGQSGLARFVKLPPVEEKKIVDIVRFEAKQQIPFNLDEVVWDYQKIGTGVVTDGFAMETEIGLFAMKRDVINRAMNHFQDVNVEVHIVQMAPLCLCNFVAYDLLNKGVEDSAAAQGEEGEEKAKDGKQVCAVALDIGADNSNLVITDGERIIWQRPIPLGGNNFTRVLTKDLKLTFAKAEHLKRNATKSPDLKKILASLKPVLNDFAGEVQRSLGYFTNTHRDAQIEYLLGLGSAFRLPGLQRYLAEKLQLDVRKLQKFERLEGDSVITAPVFTENILSFAVAYGVAVQGLKQTRLQTNLLPPEIRMERLIRAKKPWAVAAAAALLFGVAGLTLSYTLEIRAVNIGPIKTEMDEGGRIQKEIDRKKLEFANQEKQVQDEESAVKSVIAGQDERLNWIQLARFINEALPRPDDHPEYDKRDVNLLYPRAKELYWTKDAREAHEKHRQRQLLAAGTGKDESGDGLDKLVQLNIEAVDCRFVDSLPAFWTNLEGVLKKAGTFESVMKGTRPAGKTVGKTGERDFPAAPAEGKGWLVEVRGFTYHTNASRFIIETLVENLARMGNPAEFAETPLAVKPTTPMPVPPPPKPNDPLKPAEVRRVDPVVNRVSHVMLFKHERDSKPMGDSFKLISGSLLPTVMLGGLGGAEGDPKAATSHAGFGGLKPGAGRSGWQPLPTGSRGAAGAGDGRTGPFTGAERPPIAGDKPPAGADDKTKPSPQAERTEFVIFFIWREPTPSDQLRPSGEGSQQ